MAGQSALLILAQRRHRGEAIRYHRKPRPSRPRHLAEVAAGCPVQHRHDLESAVRPADDPDLAQRIRLVAVIREGKRSGAGPRSWSGCRGPGRPAHRRRHRAPRSNCPWSGSADANAGVAVDAAGPAEIDRRPRPRAGEGVEACRGPGQRDDGLDESRAELPVIARLDLGADCRAVEPGFEARRDADLPDLVAVVLDERLEEAAAILPARIDAGSVAVEVEDCRRRPRTGRAGRRSRRPTPTPQLPIP